MSQSDCIFCRIVAGEIPCARVFEDEHMLAFLDIGPLAEGHLLCIPKLHATTIEDMSPDQVASITRLLPRLSRAVRTAAGAPALNILQNNGPESGQAVFHVHFHLIPRKDGDGLGYRWNSSTYPAGRADQICDAIRGALSAEA